MSYVIIGVHGLSNKPPKEQHANDWVAAIKEGLARNCFLSEQPIQFISVHWADINNRAPLDPDLEPYQPTPKDQPIVRYRDGWLSMARAYASDVPGDIIQKGKEWLGLDPVSNVVLERKLPDLDKYYTSEENRRVLRTMVRTAIEENRNKRIMLIAHSMGSIIAYDALRELGQADTRSQVENFVTIGSPLGLPTVAVNISQEWRLLRTPSVVRRWVNLADPRDPVAFDPHLTNDYEANDQGVRVEDDLILNNYVGPDGKPNRHKIYGYLRCPEMSELVRGIL
jgi:pimeloyl-ACP methyl ester carboxylesterase